MYSANATGGETTHTLSIAELPRHDYANTISVSATQDSHEHEIYSGSGKCANAAVLAYAYCYAVGGAVNDSTSRRWRSTTGTGSDIVNAKQPAIHVTAAISNKLEGLVHATISHLT